MSKNSVSDFSPVWGVEDRLGTTVKVCILFCQVFLQINSWRIKNKCYTREYWKSYIGEAFPSSYYLAPSPLPTHLPSASCLSFSVLLCVASQAFWRERGEGVWGAKSYGGENAWSYINNLILSGKHLQTVPYHLNNNISKTASTNFTNFTMDIS